MPKRILLLAILLGLRSLCHAQFLNDDEWNVPSEPEFEVYSLASGMKTIDVVTPGLVVITNPNQPPDFGPRGLASGARVGFVWRREKLGLVAECGFHKYADRTGSTSMAPLMAGLRVYSQEHFRTAFFGEGLAGAYRWTVNSGSTNFATFKGLALAGGGMDIRLTHRLVWRVFEVQLGLAAGQNGPLLTGGPSTGIAYRFGSH